MPSDDLSALPLPTFAGGERAIATTPVVGEPRGEYADLFIPGEEELEDGELRVTILGSGNPWVTRAQSSGSILVEVGNSERDLLVFDLGSGSLANFASLKLPVNDLDKVFITHLHADHTADLITLFGSYRKSGWVDRGVSVWGPSGSEPRLGTAHFVDAIREACNWDSESALSISFSWSVISTLIPSLKVAPSSTSATSSWPLKRRQRSWAASSSL